MELNTFKEREEFDFYYYIEGINEFQNERYLNAYKLLSRQLREINKNKRWNRGININAFVQKSDKFYKKLYQKKLKKNDPVNWDEELETIYYKSHLVNLLNII